MTNPLPLIAVIGTGGTISSLGASTLDVLDNPDFGQKLSCEALLERFPETRLVADPVTVTFRQVGSTEIGPNEWVEMRALIHRIARDDPAVAGFVIPHGTATLEETGFFLNLTLAVTQPVVLVGAQRPASALGTDAGMNLVNALQVAGAPEARGKGVLAVLNGEIHAARDVVKTSTYRLQTFRSYDFGALGHVDGDGVHFYRSPSRPHMPDTPFAGSISARCHGSTLSIPMPAPMARSSMRRSPEAPAGSSRPGLRRAARPHSNALHSNARPSPGSWSCNAAAPPAAGSPRAAACARAGSSPARI